MRRCCAYFPTESRAFDTPCLVARADGKFARLFNFLIHCLNMANGKAGAPQGNQNARKGKPFLAMLHKILTDDEMNKPEKQRRLWQAGQQLLTLAAAGEEWAVKELANRLDGKAIQGVELSDPDGKALNLFEPGMLRGMEPEEITQLRHLLNKAGKAASSE